MLHGFFCLWVSRKLLFRHTAHGADRGLACIIFSAQNSALFTRARNPPLTSVSMSPFVSYCVPCPGWPNAGAIGPAWTTNSFVTL